MKFFIDAETVAEIEDLVECGLLDGININPVLIQNSGRDFRMVVKDLCKLLPVPVFFEVTAPDFDGIMKEAAVLRKIAHNVVIKLPPTMPGLKACRMLSAEGVQVNVTLCFTVNQAGMAAKAGAAYVSAFIGRLTESGQGDGLRLIQEVMNVYNNYPFKTQLIASSIHDASIPEKVGQIGVHAVNLKPHIIRQMYAHSLTDAGMAQFKLDWGKLNQTIL